MAPGYGKRRRKLMQNEKTAPISASKPAGNMEREIIRAVLLTSSGKNGAACVAAYDLDTKQSVLCATPPPLRGARLKGSEVCRPSISLKRRRFRDAPSVRRQKTYMSRLSDCIESEDTKARSKTSEKRSGTPTAARWPTGSAIDCITSPAIGILLKSSQSVISC